VTKKEMEGEAKAKGLIAQEGKVGYTEEKMREDEDELGRLDAYVRRILSPSKKDWCYTDGPLEKSEEKWGEEIGRGSSL
jgi:hypothetical protein